MNPDIYLTRWKELKKNGPALSEIDKLARQVALSFMDACLYCKRYEPFYIDLLCEMATSFEDAELNARVSGALFGIVVEGLCDEFEEMQVDIYDRVMCQIIAFCRRLPQGAELDRRLAGFGYTTQESLLGRAAALRKSLLIKDTLERPEKIIFLSRITIGADVAITSVLIQRFAEAFPDAEIVLLGGAKLNGLFGAGPRIRVHELNYPRHGKLLARFSSWMAVLEAIDQEAAPVDGRVQVVDPDSRLTQLGILPVIEPGKYFFFNSRDSHALSDQMSLSELANEWANRVLPEPGFCSPTTWIDRRSKTTVAGLLERIRRVSKRLVTVNLGVGGNTRKRLDADFELKLLAKLLLEPGTTLILDCGAGDEEKKRAERLLEALRAQGFNTDATDLRSEISLSAPGIISVECGVGEIAALISGSDEFIGYDSACQHIAAATGIPTYTVFAGSNNPRFVRRWHALGKARSEIIHVDTLSSHQMFDNDDVIHRINYARNNQ